MEFHFLRVLKTFAKRRCEKKLEICVYHITKHPRGKKSHNTERGRESFIDDSFFLVEGEFRRELFLLPRAWKVISEDGWWKFTWKNLDDGGEDSNSVPIWYESDSLSTLPSTPSYIFRFFPYIYIPFHLFTKVFTTKYLFLKNIYTKYLIYFARNYWKIAQSSYSHHIASKILLQTPSKKQM